MYRLFVEELANFRQLLTLTDSEYVDAFLKEGMSSIINDSGELFGCFSIRTECSASETNLHCRLPRKLLLNLAEEGTIDVDYNDKQITLTFRTNKKLCSATFTRQDIFSEGYMHKLDIMTKLDKKVSFNIAEIGLISKIAKSNSCIINSNNGVVGVRISSSSRIYQKIDLHCNFSSLSSSLQKLRTADGNMFSIENFIGSQKGNLLLLATKVRDDVNDEFALIEQERSKFKCEVDFQALVNFFIKMRPKVDFVELDLQEQQVIINQDRLSFTVPIIVTSFVKSEAATINTIKIPAFLITNVFGNLPNFKCNLEQKRNFVRVENSNLIILL